ncbi:MAG: hypothetical protein QXM06_05105 [Archaeoglobaceae archaeon]
MYVEVWVEEGSKSRVFEKLTELCGEVYEVFCDYNYIVRVSEANLEELRKIEGIKRIKRHYNC